MKCKYDDDRIISLLEGQLEDSKKEELNNHLKSCERCAKKFKVFAYSEKFFRQEVEVEQTLADKVMLNIDENKYKRNTKLTKAAVVFYRYKSVWKTALSVTAVFLMFLALRYSSFIIDIKDNIVAAIEHMDNTISEESVPTDFYDMCIKKAKNQTQIDELNKLKNDTTHGSIGYYERAALTIIGDLPDNQKRLSLAEAEKLVDSKDNPRDIVDAFNEIAGAPDFEGGSGITWAIYFLDEMKSEAIYVSGNMLFSYVKYDEDGKRKQSRRLGEDTLPIPAFSSNPLSSYDKNN